VWRRPGPCESRARESSDSDKPHESYESYGPCADYEPREPDECCDANESRDSDESLDSDESRGPNESNEPGGAGQSTVTTSRMR
jgi:hypothetical protein